MRSLLAFAAGIAFAVYVLAQEYMSLGSRLENFWALWSIFIDSVLPLW